MPGRLVVVDDDPSVRRSLSEGLTEEGYQVRPASSAEEALPLLAESPRPDLVLSDVRMTGLGGLELLELIAATGAEVAFLDLRRSRAGDGWLDRPLVARGIDRYIAWRSRWRENADGLLFVREMTPSTTEGAVDAGGRGGLAGSPAYRGAVDRPGDAAHGPCKGARRPPWGFTRPGERRWFGSEAGTTRSPRHRRSGRS